MAPLVLRPCSAYHQQRANHVAYRLVTTQLLLLLLLLLCCARYSARGTHVLPAVSALSVCWNYGLLPPANSDRPTTYSRLCNVGASLD